MLAARQLAGQRPPHVTPCARLMAFAYLLLITSSLLCTTLSIRYLGLRADGDKSVTWGFVFNLMLASLVLRVVMCLIVALFLALNKRAILEAFSGYPEIVIQVLHGAIGQQESILWSAAYHCLLIVQVWVVKQHVLHPAAMSTGDMFIVLYICTYASALTSLMPQFKALSETIQRTALAHQGEDEDQDDRRAEVEARLGDTMTLSWATLACVGLCSATVYCLQLGAIHYKLEHPNDLSWMATFWVIVAFLGCLACVYCFLSIMLCREGGSAIMGLCLCSCSGMVLGYCLMPILMLDDVVGQHWSIFLLIPFIFYSILTLLIFVMGTAAVGGAFDKFLFQEMLRPTSSAHRDSDSSSEDAVDGSDAGEAHQISDRGGADAEERHSQQQQHAAEVHGQEDQQSAHAENQLPRIYHDSKGRSGVSLSKQSALDGLDIVSDQSNTLGPLGRCHGRISLPAQFHDQGAAYAVLSRRLANCDNGSDAVPHTEARVANGFVSFSTEPSACTSFNLAIYSCELSSGPISVVTVDWVDSEDRFHIRHSGGTLMQHDI